MNYQQITKNTNLLKLKEVIETIDKIDKIDNNININEINFVETNQGYNQKETELKESVLEKESVLKVGSKVTLIDKLLQIWCQEYFISKGISYVIHSGKDHKGLASLIAMFKKEHFDLDELKLLEFFKQWLKKVFALHDTFLRSNCSPMLYYININKINLLLSNSNSRIKKTNTTRNYNISLK